MAVAERRFFYIPSCHSGSDNCGESEFPKGIEAKYRCWAVERCRTKALTVVRESRRCYKRANNAAFYGLLEWG